MHFSLWLLQTGCKECVLKGHEHPISCLLLLIPQTYIVLTGSSDKTIRVRHTRLLLIINNIIIKWIPCKVWDLSYMASVSDNHSIQVLKEHCSAVKVF